MADGKDIQFQFSPPEGVDASVKLPLHHSAALSERDAIERTRRYFGHPVVAVEITPEQFGDALEETKQWFIDNWGIIRFRMFDVTTGVREIQMTDDVRDVQEVHFEAVRVPPLVFDRDFPFFAPFPLRAEGGIVFSYPTGLYSGIVQQLQWIEQLKRIFSAEAEFEFDRVTRVLRIFPAFEVGEKRLLVEYTSNSMQIEELFGEALVTFLRYFRAEVGERLGQIRSKYDSIPVAGGAATLNGSALLEWARDEKEKLTEWAHARNAPYRFLTG
jgi:hypothetical protein